MSSLYHKPHAYEDRYVAYLDILGFRNLVDKSLHDRDLFNTLRSILTSSLHDDVDVKLYQFSDSFIQQCGAGLELVDIKAAAAKGIKVANVPTDISGNADSVAELGIYLMIGISRDFKEMASSMKDGHMGVPRGRTLVGKTVGIVGLGGIGQALIKRLKPFGVHLIGIKRHDPQKAKEELGLQWAGTPFQMDELLGKSDYVVLCLPMSAETRNMIGRREFEKMRNDAYLINLARGGLVDREALLEALSCGQIAGAGLDVFWEEPPDPNDPIFRHNVLATPHIAGSTDISTAGIVEGVTENIRRLEAGQEILYVKT